MRILVDTDVLIDVLRGNDRGIIAAERIKQTEVCCCSVVTVAEIRAGMRAGEEQTIRTLLDDMEVLDVTRPVAWTAGAIQQGHRRYVIELPDCLIAATALIHDLSIFTRNRRHYPFVGLKFATGEE